MRSWTSGDSDTLKAHANQILVNWKNQEMSFMDWLDIFRSYTQNTGVITILDSMIAAPDFVEPRDHQ